METIITRNTGTQETRGDEDYKSKPKQNHCYGHTPQIQKGAKTSNTGVERMPFVTVSLLEARQRVIQVHSQKFFNVNHPTGRGTEQR